MLYLKTVQSDSFLFILKSAHPPPQIGKNLHFLH